jgi:hypothetical protein
MNPFNFGQSQAQETKTRGSPMPSVHDINSANSEQFRSAPRTCRPNGGIVGGRCITRLSAMSVLERRDTMKAITELTIAAAAVALLVAAALQINHAQASAPIPVAQDIHGNSAAGVKTTPIRRGP